MATPKGARPTVAFGLGVFMVACSAEPPPAANTPFGMAALPQEVAGWRALDDGQIYDTESIYSYIDGHAEVDRTLRHELAHLVAHLRSSGRRIDPHGAEWRKACTDLGIPGESRCHTLPFTTRQIQRKYLYQCPACGVEVPRVRKFRRAVACYACCRKHTGGRYDDRFRLKKVR